MQAAVAVGFLLGVWLRCAEAFTHKPCCSRVGTCSIISSTNCCRSSNYCNSSSSKCSSSLPFHGVTSFSHRAFPLPPPPCRELTLSAAPTAAAPTTAAVAATNENDWILQLASAASLTEPETSSLLVLRRAKPFSLSSPPLAHLGQRILRQQQKQQQKQQQRLLLGGFMSLEQLAFHYCRHHAGYVRTLNSIAEKDPKLREMSLEEAARRVGVGSPESNSCGQAYNHSFFWRSFTLPEQNNKPLTRTSRLLDSAFGGVEPFKQKFKAAATAHFGSGWVWLGLRGDGSAEIAETHDGVSLLSARPDLVPLLVIDVWEHAYYLDYKNARANYVEGFVKSIFWEAVEERLRKAEKPQEDAEIR